MDEVPGLPGLMDKRLLAANVTLSALSMLMAIAELTLYLLGESAIESKISTYPPRLRYRQDAIFTPDLPKPMLTHNGDFPHPIPPSGSRDGNTAIQPPQQQQQQQQQLQPPLPPSENIPKDNSDRLGAVASITFDLNTTQIASVPNTSIVTPLLPSVAGLRIQTNYEPYDHSLQRRRSLLIQQQQPHMPLVTVAPMDSSPTVSSPLRSLPPFSATTLCSPSTPTTPRPNDQRLRDLRTRKPFQWMILASASLAMHGSTIANLIINTSDASCSVSMTFKVGSVVFYITYLLINCIRSGIFFYRRNRFPNALPAVSASDDGEFWRYKKSSDIVNSNNNGYQHYKWVLVAFIPSIILGIVPVFTKRYAFNERLRMCWFRANEDNPLHTLLVLWLAYYGWVCLGLLALLATAVLVIWLLVSASWDIQRQCDSIGKVRDLSQTEHQAQSLQHHQRKQQHRNQKPVEQLCMREQGQQCDQAPISSPPEALAMPLNVMEDGAKNKDGSSDSDPPHKLGGSDYDAIPSLLSSQGPELVDSSGRCQEHNQHHHHYYYSTAASADDVSITETTTSSGIPPSEQSHNYWMFGVSPSHHPSARPTRTAIPNPSSLFDRSSSSRLPLPGVGRYSNSAMNADGIELSPLTTNSSSSQPQPPPKFLSSMPTTEIHAPLLPQLMAVDGTLQQIRKRVHKKVLQGAQKILLRCFIPTFTHLPLAIGTTYMLTQYLAAAEQDDYNNSRIENGIHVFQICLLLSTFQGTLELILFIWLGVADIRCGWPRLLHSPIYPGLESDIATQATGSSMSTLANPAINIGGLCNDDNSGDKAQNPHLYPLSPVDQS
ncbi:hypothetical protein EV182_000798 [Spiromyces aspiralis]|uniref:Uncharacterized protein n=1 Tax=Spiromyces aspiralis TaxID=68401 RepID=A0ACC1HMW3_9FUNG|nr:hypothetical protein EV182_000798 [Spiromyces aspiralis]